jgi:TIR domain
MAEVFLSYSRTDRPIAQAIAGELQRLGVDVWWDHELIGGDDYRARIAEVLARSVVAAVIWSRRSIESQWVVGEASAARERKVLIPITIDGAAPPLDFRPLHTIDFANWIPGDQLPQAFLKAVSDRVGRALSYTATAAQSGLLGRFARKATQAWYLDFESVLFYLIGQGLACFLCTLPMAYFANAAGAASSPWPAWMPYLLIIGTIVSPLYMRPILEVSRLTVAVPLFVAAALISVVSYVLGSALFTRLGDATIVLVGPATLLLLLVTAVADRAHRR